MNILKIAVSNKKVDDFSCDLLVSFGAIDKKGKLVFDKAIEGAVSAAATYGEYSGKSEQSVLLYPPFDISGKKLGSYKAIHVVGLGKLDEPKSDDELAEIFRLAGGLIAKSCKRGKVKKLGILMPRFAGINESLFARAISEGLQLGIYQFLNYKKESDDDYKGLMSISVLQPGKVSSVKKGITLGINSGRAGCIARDMANEPGNGWTPTHFANYSNKLTKLKDVKCTVLEKSDLKKKGLGGILAVNQGSHEPPKFIILDYCPKNYSDTVMFVGKGLTFDSGGISIKPAQGMMDMKYDMCGGAAVIAAFEAIAREQPSMRLLCLVPSTDNMNGGGAVKPGDIITHYGGITSEIENTDAEGRLILADALAYGIELYKPDCVVDLATLTGAVIIALGHHHSGIMTNSDALCGKLTTAGEAAGEPLWRLPLGNSYAKQIKSNVADIKNTGGRPAGSITAAEYLHKFVGKTPWAHLDIAGTAWDFTEKAYIPKGPSGIGTRTLIEFIRRWKSGKL